MAATSQAERVLSMLAEPRLWRGGMTAAELAEHHGCTVRQLRRDRGLLEAFGYPTQVQQHDDGAYRVVFCAQDAAGRPALGQAQAYGVAALFRILGSIGESALTSYVADARRQILSSIDERDVDRVRALERRIVFVPESGPRIYDESVSNCLDVLLTAILRSERVDAAYVSASGNRSEGVLSPYALVLYRRGLYVVGKLGRKGLRIYAVERFAEAERRRGDTFVLPDDFRAERLFEGAFGLSLGGKAERVEIDFSPDVTHLVESRKWHRTQRLRTLRGGWTRLSFQSANLNEVTSWVLSWGP